MSRPVLFVIHDDPEVVRALHDDLSRRFGNDCQVTAESSAAAGLATLRDLAAGHEPVALLIADHPMREMPGVEFLTCAHALHPLAKRVLLVERDYSAGSPVVKAMTLGQADYHLSKPWMLEQDLYRPVSQFLADWAKDQEASSSCSTSSGGSRTAARTTCGSCSRGSTCRSTSTPLTPSRAAACSKARDWTRHACPS